MRSSGSFTLRPGAESAALTIPLFEDTTPESMEIFTVTLSAGQDVSLTVESANVTILDTDGERIIVHVILPIFHSREHWKKTKQMLNNNRQMFAIPLHIARVLQLLLII